jgi:hypothetical protein
MLFHPIFILLAVLAFVIFFYLASRSLSQKFFRIDADNIPHLFVAIECFAVAIYSLLFVPIGESPWFVL